MLGFLGYLEEKLRLKVDPVVAKQRKMNKLNAKVGSSDPEEALAASKEKHMFIRDLEQKKREQQQKKQIALNKKLRKR